MEKIASPNEVAPGWRNWQTQRTQNPPRATSWGFDPPSRHQDNKRLIWKMIPPVERSFLFGGCFGGCWFLSFSWICFRYRSSDSIDDRQTVFGR